MTLKKNQGSIFFKLQKNKGVALIMAVMVILLLGIILGGLASLERYKLFSNQTLMLSDEIFYLAESGIEVGINWLRNLDPIETNGHPNWYNNGDVTSGLPQPNFQFSMGTGQTVSVSANYPATVLRTDSAVNASYLEVQSVDCFKALGQINHPTEKFYILVGNDLIRISNYDSSLRRLLVDGSVPSEVVSVAHFATETVYPLAILSSDISAASTTLPVLNTRGFLNAGTVKLYHTATGNVEFLRYTGKTDTSFLVCQRASNKSTALDPTPIQVTNKEWWIYPVDYEVTLVSKGSQSGVSKTLEVTVQYKRF